MIGVEVGVVLLLVWKLLFRVLVSVILVCRCWCLSCNLVWCLCSMVRFVCMVLVWFVRFWCWWVWVLCCRVLVSVVVLCWWLVWVVKFCSVLVVWVMLCMVFSMCWL